MNEEEFHQRMSGFLPLMRESLRAKYKAKAGRVQDSQDYLSAALQLSLHFFFQPPSAAGAEAQRRVTAYRLAEDRLYSIKRLLLGVPFFTATIIAAVMRRRIASSWTEFETAAWFTYVASIFPLTLYPFCVRLFSRSELHARNEAYRQLVDLCQAQPYASLLQAD